MNDVMEKFGANNLFRTIVLVCDWLNRDEYVQLNGIVALIDCTDMAIKGFEFLRCLREVIKL